MTKDKIDFGTIICCINSEKASKTKSSGPVESGGALKELLDGDVPLIYEMYNHEQKSLIGTVI